MSSREPSFFLQPFLVEILMQTLKISPLATLLAMLSMSGFAHAVENQQYYEVRSYLLGDSGDADAIDGYLQNALLPALERQGIGPVGVFGNAADDTAKNPRVVVVVIPYASADAIHAVTNQVTADPEYQSAAKPYLDRGPRQAPFDRIQSELLVAMKCWPQLKVPDQALSNENRVFELRIYESATERIGNLKVEMFNEGEVPIFLDCGITPIFIGQAMIGPYTPNLTYLTMYPNEESRRQSWQQFMAHPDWKSLSGMEKYKGTVSKIHKYVLVPKSYSQL
jgi:hypothetical protein